MYFVDIIKQADTATVIATLENATSVMHRTDYKIAVGDATKQDEVDNATAVMVRRACDAELTKRKRNA